MIWGYLLIIISAISFSLIPIFALYAYDSGVSTITLLFLRFAIATVIFFAYLILKKYKWKITRRQLLSLILLGGVLYMAQSTCYFSAVKYIPASLAALLLYLNPIFVAVLSFFANSEKPSKQLILAISLSLIGIIFVLGSPEGEVNLIGIMLAVGAAIVYSVYIVLGDQVTKQLPPMITCAYIAMFSSLSFFIVGTFTNTLDFDFDGMGWMMVMCVAILSTVVAMFTFFAGMNKIGPTKASILSMVEPVVTFIFSALLFQEKMTTIQMLGGVIVLFGACMVVLARGKNNQKQDIYHSKIS